MTEALASVPSRRRTIFTADEAGNHGVEDPGYQRQEFFRTYLRTIGARLELVHEELTNLA